MAVQTVEACRSSVGAHRIEACRSSVGAHPSAACQLLLATQKREANMTNLPSIPREWLGVHGRGTIRQYMQPGEQEVLIALVNSVVPHAVVEIGVNAGLTARALLAAVPSIQQYIGVDVDETYKFEIAAQASEWPAEPGLLVRDDPRFRLILRGHNEVWPRLRDPVVVFIDGDHGRNHVRADSEWASGIVELDGMIIWHDYGNPTVQVTEVLDRLYEQGRQIRHVAGTWLAFERAGKE